MAQRRDQAEHDRLVGAAVQLLRSQGYAPVYGDLVTMSKPEQIGGYVPDATAHVAGALKVIVEAETWDTINDGHTASQWVTFARAASRAKGSFVVVVPKGSEQAARDRLAQLQIDGRVVSF